MASNKEFKTRIQHKIDTPENWAKATNFIPLDGEIIIYDYSADEGLQNKIKIGDGSSYLADLPFINTNFYDNTLIYNAEEGTLSHAELGPLDPDSLSLFGLTYGITTFYIELTNSNFSMNGFYQLCNFGNDIALILNSSFATNQLWMFNFNRTDSRWVFDYLWGVYLRGSLADDGNSGILLKNGAGEVEQFTISPQDETIANKAFIVTGVDDEGNVTYGLSDFEPKLQAKGSSTKGIYVKTDGTITTTSTYAGGTKVTLNGTNKGASAASFYAPTTFGTDGWILQAKGEKVAPVWVDPSDLLSGDFLPVDELTDSYAKVRPLLLSDTDGEVSLNPGGISLNNTTQVSSIQITPTELELLGSDSTIHISPETLQLSDAATDVQMSSSGVFLEKNDNYAYDSVSLTSSGLSATSEYDTDIQTVISGTTGISLSDASDIEFKTIDLNYNGLSINNNSQTLTSLDAINGLRLIDMDNAKSIILSHEVMFIDRGLSSMRLDEDEFSLTKTISETNENKTTLTPSSLNLSSQYGNLTVSIPNTTNASSLITTGQSPLQIQASNINLEGIVNINGAGYISQTPTANNSIVNKAYVDEKTSNLTAQRVIIYQDDGTNSGNYNPAYGTFVVENQISTDLDDQGNSIYTVTFDEEEAGITAASIDFTGNSYVNATNVQSAIDILSTRVSSAHNGLTQLSSTVGNHTTNINNLDNTVASHTSSINSMNTTVNSHTTTINSHTTSINNLQTQINNLVTDVWAIGSTPPDNGKLLWIDTNATTGGLKYLPTGSTNTATNWKHIPVAWT